jgi:hypothetical protein
VIADKIQGSGSVEIKSGRVVSGDGLQYGMKLNPRCITLPEDTEPRQLPRNSFERAMLWLNQRL